MTQRVRTRQIQSDGHYVYLIGGPHQQYKIGHTAHPKRRVSQLQSGSTVPLFIEEVWQQEREAAVLMESAAHRLFARLHVSGEWFDIKGEEATSVLNLLHVGEDGRAAYLADLVCRMRLTARDAETARGRWKLARSQDRSRVGREGREEGARLDKQYAALRAEALAAGLLRDHGEGWRLTDAKLVDYWRQLAA